MDQGVQIADWEIRRAQLEDIEALLHLYVEAAKWIRTSKGIVQWREEKFTKEYLETWIVENEVFVFVVYLASELIGGFSVHWEMNRFGASCFIQTPVTYIGLPFRENIRHKESEAGCWLGRKPTSRT